MSAHHPTRSARSAVRARLPGRGDDAGRVVLLIAGLFAVLGMLIVGGINVTALQLARVHVLDAADAAAADAADSVDEAGIYRGGVGEQLRLSDADVRTTATRSLAGQPVPAHVLGWQVAGGAVAADGRTAVVRVSAVVRPPMLAGLWSGVFGDVHVSVQSRARADVG
ncbi:hypothetical protein HJ588_07985 [Flexivirga sp. ID2601S]|uniref:Uncharacterized protein n=1 Tax=Flexivirga aerilata TaxID=1656889 RepID=A0A849AR17_9MICO|nr:hypothetical protein [Flexivirga aerilata]NNG39212.1 hypothetical protein [Flexivirga aerilata]